MTFQNMHGRAEAGFKGKIAAHQEKRESIKRLLQGRADRVIATTTTPAVIIKATKTTAVATTTTKAVVITPPKVTVATTASAKVTASSASATSASSISTTASVSSVSSLSSASSTQPSVIPSTTSALPTSQIPTTSSTPVLATTARDLSLASSPSQTATASGSNTSASDVPASTGGIGTGTIVGIVGGVVGGILVICLIIGFILRRLRKRNNARGFKPETFRRSAIMLKDDKEEKDFRPRPPSMIERRNASTPVPGGNSRTNLANVPSAPPSLYGNEHPRQYPQFGAAGAQYSSVPPSPAGGQPHMYSAIPGAYGVPPPLAPYNGAQYDQAGYGAPPIPGTYGPGAYAAYGPDPRYPQYPHQHQGYPQYSYQQQQHGQYAQNHPRQPMVGYGNTAAEMSRSESLTSSNSIPNSFARSTSSSPPPAPQPAQRSVELSSGSASSGSASSGSASSPAASGSTTLTRRPTQTSGAPPAYTDDEDSARWAAIRDQKRPHEIVMSVTNDGAERVESTSSAAPKAVEPTLRVTPAATAVRPMSEYTLYGEEDDAYGGM